MKNDVMRSILFLMGVFLVLISSFKTGEISFGFPQNYMVHRLEVFALIVYFGSTYMAHNIERFVNTKKVEETADEMSFLGSKSRRLSIILISTLFVLLIVFMTVGSADNWSF